MAAGRFGDAAWLVVGLGLVGGLDPLHEFSAEASLVVGASGQRGGEVWSRATNGEGELSASGGVRGRDKCGSAGAGAPGEAPSTGTGSALGTAAERGDNAASTRTLDSGLARKVTFSTPFMGTGANRICDAYARWV